MCTTVVGSGGAFVQVIAICAVADKSRKAIAGKRAESIDAIPLSANIAVATFINICEYA